MCGIVGIMDSRIDASEIRRYTRRMADQIVHRGPDDQGHYSWQGFGIGMRRLSIIDLSGGHQPIANEAGDVHVVCNGEIYNYVELRKDLLSRGHRFTTNSDTEVIVHLYEEYGDDCLKQLRGMFGLAILDVRQGGRLLLARDRLGKKPLFYSVRNGQLLFASEMKSLLSVEPELSRPDYGALGEYLQFGFIHQPSTIYKDILRLPAGNLGVFEKGQFRIQPYWELRFDANDSLSDKAWLDALEEALSESVRIRLRSDVPLGVFLSGGLDSSAVVAFASESGLKPLKTFTVGFDRPEWDESDDAARIARHFGTEHHLLRLGEADMRDNLEDSLQRIIGHCDEPFGDASALPTYFISRLARQHATVILSGDGGDELFAGYSSYRGMLFAQQYRRWIPEWLGRDRLPNAIQGLSRMLSGTPRYQGLRIAKVLRDSALPTRQAYRNKASIWDCQEISQLLTSDAFDQARYLSQQYLPNRLWDILHAEGDLVSRLTEIDIHSYLTDDILVKVDRMSMAHSLEVRSPLLDHRVVELAARMPSRMKIRGRVSKYALREVLRQRLPAKTLSKGKQGFSVPLRDWFQGSLAGWVQDYIGPSGYLPKEIFSQSKVQATLREHRVGAFDHSRKIWVLLAFAAWHRLYQAEPRSYETDSKSLFGGISSRDSVRGQSIEDEESAPCES